MFEKYLPPKELPAEKAAEKMNSNKRVAEAVLKYRQLQDQISRGQRTAEDSDLVREAKNKIRVALRNKGIELEIEMSGGIDVSLKNFIDIFPRPSTF